MDQKYEVKKAAYRQTAQGKLITLVLHPHEDTDDLTNADIGAVFEATFRELRNE